MEECLADLSGVFIKAYADDTSIYAVGDSDDEVRTKLRKAGKRLLAFMRQAGLAANAEKTNFVMFNSEGGPLEIGDVLVERN